MKLGKLRFCTQDGSLIMNRAFDLDYLNDKEFMQYVIDKDARQKSVKPIGEYTVQDSVVTQLVQFI
jgi:hypothetical protein